MVWMGIRIFSIPTGAVVLMGGSRQGVTQRSFWHTEPHCRVLWGTEGKDQGVSEAMAACAAGLGCSC